MIRIKERVNAQRANGKFTTSDRIRDERIADAKLQLQTQVAADDQPITERVPEYALDYDEGGNYVGLKPARP
jgi:hypothetical protein